MTSSCPGGTRTECRRLRHARPSRAKTGRIGDEVLRLGVVDGEVGARDRRHADEAADLDVVGGDAVLAADEPLDAVMLTTFEPTPSICAPRRPRKRHRS